MRFGPQASTRSQSGRRDRGARKAFRSVVSRTDDHVSSGLGAQLVAAAAPWTQVTRMPSASPLARPAASAPPRVPRLISTTLFAARPPVEAVPSGPEAAQSGRRRPSRAGGRCLPDRLQDDLDAVASGAETENGRRQQIRGPAQVDELARRTDAAISGASIEMTNISRATWRLAIDRPIKQEHLPSFADRPTPLRRTSPRAGR